MVNTFLPLPTYQAVAKTLDIKRLGKQRVEGFQILKANLGMTRGWRNHPAAVMWRGHEGSLAIYTLFMCARWVSLGYKDNIAPQVIQLMDQLPVESFSTPWWLGNEDFHKSHQSNLKRKDPLHYQYEVQDDLPYLWPTQTIGTLRTTKVKGAKNA